MQSMYEAIHGQHPLAKVAIMAWVYGLPSPETVTGDIMDHFGRYRDAWIEEHAGNIVVRILTRNGGDNRPDWETVSANLAAHPHYLRDEDEPVDSTYRSYYFGTTPEVSEIIRIRNKKTGHALTLVDLAAKFQEALDDLEAATPERRMEILKAISEGTRVVNGDGTETNLMTLFGQSED